MIKKNKKTILCFVNYYIPGYKAGGPIRSIANIVETFGDKFDIKIICANHDDLDIKPYKNIKVIVGIQLVKRRYFTLHQNLLILKV